MNDYRITLGGVNKVILAHQEMFQKNGYEYLYIYPVWKKHRKYEYWKIIRNNHYVSIKSISNLIRYLYKLQKRSHICAEIHIHHLIKVFLPDLDKLLGQIKSSVKFYIHDYFTICPSVKLLRNDTEFCGCEKMSLAKCEGCKYYSDGKTGNLRVRKLLQKYRKRITFIAPSDAAKKQWVKAFPEYGEKVQVIYHQIYDGTYDGNRQLIEKNGIIKIAYIGEPLSSKGWDMWNQILEKNADNRYKFYYLGNASAKLENVTKVNVDFRKNMDAMTTALRDNEIDCILLWSILAETYSYTYYEGVSANAFVITNNSSGNIAYQVKAHANGISFNNKEEVLDLFSNYNYFRNLINDFKSRKEKGPARLIENPEILRHIGPALEKPILPQPKQKISINELGVSTIFKAIDLLRQFKKEVLS